MLTRVKSLLGSVQLYVGLQKAVGADRVRYLCLDELGIKPGDCVLDIGCGPAYYFDRLPAVRYYGFDTSERYIAHARKAYGDRGEFRCEIFAERHLTELPPVDHVLMLGLLHHLPDETSRELLDLTSRVISPTGQVIAVDPTFEAKQNPISRWMSANDRGEHVRLPEEFVELADDAFGKIDGEIVNRVTRVPTTMWMMRMSSPRVSERS